MSGVDGTARTPELDPTSTHARWAAGSAPRADLHPRDVKRSGPPMVARHHRAADTRIAEAPRNWGLFLILVLCLEFWLIVASYFAHGI